MVDAGTAGEERERHGGCTQQGDVGSLLGEGEGEGVSVTGNVLCRGRGECATDSRCSQQGAERHHRTGEAKKLGMEKTC